MLHKFWTNASIAPFVPILVTALWCSAVSTQCSFARAPTDINLLHVAGREAAVYAHEHTGNCLIEVLFLATFHDAATQCSFEADECTAFKCLQIDKVEKLSQAFEDSKAAAKAT